MFRTKQGSKTFKDFFCLLSKTFQRPLRAISCRKIAMYKHHFYHVISLVKSHPKMHFFVHICENLASINQSILLARKSYNQILTKDFLRFFTQFKDFSETFKDFKDRYEPCFWSFVWKLRSDERRMRVDETCNPCSCLAVNSHQL
jgi:hypothetical protein